nr:hypothetical protein [Candidatus Sigynarchaeota archaeon]
MITTHDYAIWFDFKIVSIPSGIVSWFYVCLLYDTDENWDINILYDKNTGTIRSYNGSSWIDASFTPSCSLVIGNSYKFKVTLTSNSTHKISLTTSTATYESQSLADQATWTRPVKYYQNALHGYGTVVGTEFQIDNLYATW